MRLIIGTRASSLALAQTEWAARLIESRCPGVRTEICKITTDGDAIRDVPLDQIGAQGIFTKAIEAALLRGEIDLAVHSMKDLPSAIDERLAIVCVPERADARDVLVLRAGFGGIDDLPPGGSVGTGSKRRACQLRRLRPDLEIRPLRGNIDTRIAKLDSGAFDGIVLAAAGLSRLGRLERVAVFLEPDVMIPACGQGALALQARADRDDLARLLAPLCDRRATVETEAERAFLAAVNGGCHMPVGARCIAGERLSMAGLLGTEDAATCVTDSLDGSPDDPARLGRLLAERLIQKLEGALAPEGL